ncbi:neurotransmitter:Na+ symporter, NSS family [Hathewaya proteolytica DSM 3090]|uniref:Neurotransmitter:Na+ symporter, NSS family n=1 Tax=Hathewaya proteolytica DSM 3090 TaxID=1121331 RepID=A0A1M6TC66_9CLOT|nr:sodium-dependent transporter [Hathewaya proteolytica]SHK54561.1 neurotransmitter:Na+ symporter, NSS family [Hathewaya proteolytica DSM 3090]
MKEKREGFSSKLAVFFAILSSAVGLGNIWKFPTVVGENGGGAFVLVYLLFVLLVGIPVLVSEFFIGRRAKKNAIGAFNTLAPGTKWRCVGGMGICAATLVFFFYSAVAGWVYSYLFKALTGEFTVFKGMDINAASKVAENMFDQTVNGSFMPIIWQGIVLFVVGFIIVKGVKNGIEKVTKVLMPILFIIIIICDIRALTISGASQGLKFLFSIDFSKITGSVIMAALGLAFFKLSIGVSSMMTYGSYFTEKDNIVGNAIKLALADIVVSLLAGIAIFPVVFQYNMSPAAGPGLLFNTIPLVFSQMPFGNALLVMFLFLTAMAATMAMISMAEPMVIYLCEEKKLNRRTATISLIIFVFAVGILTVHSKSIFANVPFSNMTFFDLYDKLSSNILLPIGGFLISIFVGYVIKKEDVIDELSNKGTLQNLTLINVYRIILRYITPMLVILVFLSSIGVLNI